MLNLQQLQPYKELAKSNVLLPIGWGDDKKAPMLRKWQLHKGFTVEELAKINNAYAVGLRLDKVFCADIDGETAVRWARFKGLLTQPPTWEVHRSTSPYHFKRFFLPDSKQIEQLPENQYGLQYGGVKVRTSKDLRWGRCDVKSISLLPNILEKQIAFNQGYYETWQIKNNYITEGTTSNAFIVDKNGSVRTYPKSKHILGGVTKIGRASCRERV